MFSGGKTAGDMHLSAGLTPGDRRLGKVTCQEKKKIEGTLEKTGLVHN